MKLFKMIISENEGIYEVWKREDELLLEIQTVEKHYTVYKSYKNPNNCTMEYEGLENIGFLSRMLEFNSIFKEEDNGYLFTLYWN